MLRLNPFKNSVKPLKIQGRIRNLSTNPSLRRKWLNNIFSSLTALTQTMTIRAEYLKGWYWNWFCFHFSIPKSLPPRVGATRLSSTPWWTSCGCYSWQSNTSSQWLHSPPSSKNTNHPSEGKKMMKKNLCPLTAGILMNLVPIHFFRPSSGRGFSSSSVFFSFSSFAL